MIEAGAIVAASFLGSAHCIGMCGGLAAAVGATQRKFWPVLARQLVYTLGRVFTYAFLGAAGGLAGQSLGRYDTTLVTMQQVFSILAGIVMLYVGLSTLGLIPKRAGSRLGILSEAWASLFKHFLNVRGNVGFFLAGLATGFLPCGLVYAFLAMAVATTNALQGMLLMAAFGLGTAPAMIAVGCGSAILSRTARIRVLRIAACAIIVMGVASIYRAIPREGNCCAGRKTASASPHFYSAPIVSALSL